MKQITIIGAIVMLMTTAISCSKTSSGYIPSNSTVPPPTRQEPVKVRLISNWQTLSLENTTVNGVSMLVGQSTLSQIVSYETGMHKQFAYVKYMGRDGAAYQPLPMVYQTPIGVHSFNFSLDFSTFKVSISNTDNPGRLVAAQDLPRFEYRYIVIPIEIYTSLNIDWNDLPMVAAALNFSL